MWKTIGENVGRYRSYPRVVGETGGKDFIVAHASADRAALATAIVRGGFEFQGQKCSAPSRIYVPKSMWSDVRDRIVAMIDEIGMGDICDFRNFMGAVIDQRAFDRIKGYIDYARQHATIVAGGGCDATHGYFIKPTVVETADPNFKTLREEIFGPVVTVHVYDDAKWHETLELVDATSPYALTGAVFSQDRQADPGSRVGAALRGRELLHQRQADRCGRRPAAIRRRACVGHERQGRIEIEPGPLGERPDHQGEFQPAAEPPLSIHGRGIADLLQHQIADCRFRIQDFRAIWKS